MVTPLGLPRRTQSPAHADQERHVRPRFSRCPGLSARLGHEAGSLVARRRAHPAPPSPARAATARPGAALLRAPGAARTARTPPIATRGRRPRVAAAGLVGEP